MFILNNFILLYQDLLLWFRLMLSMTEFKSRSYWWRYPPLSLQVMPALENLGLSTDWSCNGTLIERPLDGCFIHEWLWLSGCEPSLVNLTLSGLLTWSTSKFTSLLLEQLFLFSTIFLSLFMSSQQYSIYSQYKCYKWSNISVHYTT